MPGYELGDAQTRGRCQQKIRAGPLRDPGPCQCVRLLSDLSLHLLVGEPFRDPGAGVLDQTSPHAFQFLIGGAARRCSVGRGQSPLHRSAGQQRPEKNWNTLNLFVLRHSNGRFRSVGICARSTGLLPKQDTGLPPVVPSPSS